VGESKTEINSSHHRASGGPTFSEVSNRPIGVASQGEQSMNNPTLYLVGGILLILFFCVMTYFFTKTFRVPHVIFLFLTFGMAMWFVAMAALSHKTKLHWRQRVDRLTKELDGLAKEKDELINNYVMDEQGNLPETVLTARSKLNRVMLDRGRVWRLCSVTAVTPAGEVQVSTAPAGVADAPPNQIDENAIIYAFLEADAGVSVKVPDNYLGEFRASAVTPTQVTLVPTDNRMLLPSQTTLIRGSAGTAETWSLYEVMPIDSHQIYAVDPNKNVHLTAVEGQPVFGDVDAQLVQTLYDPARYLAEFRANLGLTPQQEPIIQAHLTSIMNSIVRDGGKKATGGAVDSEDNIFVKIQFKKDYEVAVDSDTGQGGLTSDYFDSTGSAMVNRLRRGNLGFLDEDQRKSVKFKSGDIAVFHQKKADELITQDIAAPVEERYVRRLIDFTYEFHKMLDRRTRIMQDVQRMQSEITSTQAAETRSAKQRDFRKMERDQLLVDKVKFEAEQQQVAMYASELRTKMATLNAELSALYRANAALAAKLEARDKQLADEINRRTEAAAATAAN